MKGGAGQYFTPRPLIKAPEVQAMQRAACTSPVLLRKFVGTEPCELIKQFVRPVWRNGRRTGLKKNFVGHFCTVDHLAQNLREALKTLIEMRFRSIASDRGRRPPEPYQRPYHATWAGGGQRNPTVHFHSMDSVAQDFRQKEFLKSAQKNFPTRPRFFFTAWKY